MANNSNEWLGKRFGRLTIVDFEHATPPYRGWLWVCKCECGNTRTVMPNDVKRGKTRSCGCLHDEVCSKKASKFKHSVKDYPRLYSIYNGIKKRCYNENEARYKDYGARGIEMCESWSNNTDGFDNFVEWSLLNNYTDDMTIDRIDVNSDYAPENCRWVSLAEQALNKRDTLWVTYKGKKIPLMTLCNEMGMSYDTVHNRVYTLNWSVERAVETPSQQEESLLSKCREKGINYSTVRDRIHKFGWSEDRALNTPSLGRKVSRKKNSKGYS